MENKINDNFIKEYFFTKLNKLYTKKFLDFEKTHFPKEIYELQYRLGLIETQRKEKQQRRTI